MELRVKPDSWTKSTPPKVHTVAEAVRYNLIPNPYSWEGYIDRLVIESENKMLLLGNIIEKLHEKGILSDEEILAMCPAHEEYKGAPSDT